MADIRIKDLTTTASSTASDDFIAVDGATNGTRKLNAYSPSFGGNATVAGTLNVGGTLQLANNTALQFLDSVGTSRRTLLTTGLNANYFGAIDAGWGGPTDIRAGTSMFLRTNGASGTFVDALTITNNGIVSVPTTFASTSTSTGALVVSGGVGVAKDLYVGGTVITLQPGSGTTAPQQKIIGPSGATYGPSLFLDASASTSGKVYIVGSGLSGDNGGLGSFYVYDVSAATSVLKIVGGNTTLAGNITTAAPAGGTAAAWKLGTVASVSPTSPNRTIEVDIGGTIYYIHAKTTNN